MNKNKKYRMCVLSSIIWGLVNIQSIPIVLCVRTSFVCRTILFDHDVGCERELFA